MASLAGTSSDDFLIATANGTEYRGGAGNDTYIFTPLIPANAVITIVDTEGANKIQLAEGLTITSSLFFDNAAQLTLSNGAVLKILGAKTFTFDIGANAVAGDTTVAPGTTASATYAQFAASLGVATLPAAGATTPASGTANYSTTNGSGGGTTPTFSVSGAAAAAEGGSATFTVTLSAPQTTATTVAYALTGSGGAIMGTDAGSSTPSQNTGTLTFAAGETTKSVTVPIITDQVTPETGEGVTITLSSPSTGTALAVATATTAITDVPPSLYTLVANVPTVLEGAAAVFTATRTGDISAAKTLTFTTVGDSSSTGAAATVGVDSTPASGTLTFAAGSNTATFSVNTVNDNTFESVEGLKVSLFDGNTSVGTSTMLLIADAATYAIAAASSNVDEGGTAKFNVTTNVADGTVGYTISGTGITAADTADGKLTGTATITSGVATISVPLSLDKITEGTETLRVTLADGITSATIAVNDTSVNEAPVFVSADTAFSVAENSTAVTTATATDATALTYSISGTDAAKFSVDSATGAIAFKTAPNFEVDAKSYALTVTASDGSLSASKNITVAVTDVNEAPTFAAATATASYAENGTAAVGTYTATDVDAGDVLTYSLGGADAALFSVSSTGALSFKATPNFEAPASAAGTNVYAVNVVATDKAGLNATQAVTVTVTDVNENPTSVAAASTSAAENQTAVGTYTTTDVDAGQTATLVYALGGDDAALFDLNTTTAVLSFKTAPNFEAPGSKAGTNAYSVTVTATDTGGLATATPQAVTVNVTNVNEAPNSVAAASASIDENLTAVGTYATTDVDAGDTLTYTLAGADAAKFAITSAGALSFVKAPDFETPGSAASSNTYTVNVIATDKGGLSVATPQVITVSVNNVNDNSATTPADSNSAVDAVPENSAQGTVVGITASSTDADTGSSITYSLSSNVGGYFQIDSATGVVSTSATPLNYEEKSGGLPVLTHDLTVLATSSDGSTASKTFTVTTQNVNEKPVVTAGQVFSVTENTTTLANASGGTAYTAATDPDGDVPTGWVITKMNGVAYNAATSPFQIDTFSGLISVQSGKTVDFDPSTGGVNTYTLAVTARDGEPLTSDEATLTINVTDANDIAPVITSGATAAVNENVTTSTAVYTTTFTDADTVNGTTTYTLGGADAALFDVSASGAVTFKASPNYEAPLDAGANNVYDITVTVKDGVNSSSAQAVAITVADLNDNTPVVAAVATPFTIAENTTTLFTASVTDGDATAAFKNITYSLTGADAAKFAVSAAGVVTVAGTGLNYEVTDSAAASNQYSFNLVATDGTNTAAAVPVVVDITDVNEAPTANALAMTARSGNSTTVYLNQPSKVNVSTNNYAEATVTTTDVDTRASVASGFGVTGHKITAVTQPTSGGTVTLAGDGQSFVVASALGLTSAFTFTYTVTDISGAGLSTTATVTVTPTLNLGGTIGDDLLIGSSAAENLDAIDGNDTIIGGGGLDTVSGGEGNDRVTFSDAAAQILGGNGNDILIVNADAVNATFDFSSSTQQATDTLSLNSTGNRVTVRGFENLDATLGQNALTIANAATGTTSLILTNAGDTITSLANTNGSSSTVTVMGLGGNDSITSGVTSAKLSIDGGAGNDTINVSSSTGNNTVIGGEGNDVISAGTGTDSLSGGNGDDTFFMSTNLTSLDTIAGGSGTDIVNASGTLADAVFTNVTTVETFALTVGATTTLTLGSLAAAAGVVTITDDAITGADAITVGSGFTNDLTISSLSTALNDTIAASAYTKNLTVTSSAAFAAGDTISGGTGTADKIVYTLGAGLNQGTVDFFTGIESIAVAASSTSGFTFTANVANVTGTNTLTIDTTNTSGVANVDLVALTGGKLTVTTGTGNDVITGSAAANTNGDNISGGAGNDTINFASAALTSLDTVAGGSGTDILKLTGTLIDSNFKNVTSVETITASAVLTSLTMDSLASTAGIVTVNDFAAANDAITVGSGFTNDLTIAITSGDDTVAASAYTKNLTVTMSAATDGNDTIAGGTGTADKIVYADAIDQSTGYNWFSGIESIAVAASSTGIFKFTTNASNVTGSNTLTIDSTNTTGIATINASATNAGRLVILTGTAADSITGSANATNGDSISAGAGNDTITFASGNLTSLDTVSGGSGTDIITSLGGALADSAFNNVTLVETLNLTTATHAVTLGSAAAAAGIVSVTDGYTGAADSLTVGSGFTSDLTVTMSPVNTGSSTISASAYTKNLTVTLTSVATASSDTTVTGGSGTSDKIVYADGADQSTGYDWFSGIESIAVAASSTGTFKFTTVANNVTGTNTLTIDSTNTTGIATINLNASNAGKLVVMTGDGADVLTVSAAATYGDNISTGAAADTINVTTTANLTSLDTINGGSGTDILNFNEAAGNAVVDLMFTKITSVENIVLTTDTTGQSVTLGLAAVAAGVVSVSAAAVTTNTNTVTIDLSAMVGTTGVSVMGGAGADTILGSSGADTINGGTAGVADIITGGAGGDAITVGTTGASKIKINLNADVAAGTTLTNADQITGLTTTVNKIDLSGTTLMSTGGTVLPLTNGTDTGLAGAAVAYMSGTAASFANLAAVANQQGLIFEVSDDAVTTGSNTLLTQAGVTEAVTFITTNIGTTTVQNTNVFIVVNDGTNSALFNYQEGTLDQGIQASELTLVGVFVANNGVAALASGDFV